MKLYGSLTSPYVRRLRVWMADIDHEFINLNIFSPEGRRFLVDSNPTMKIPMLVDGDNTVFDSGVIQRYVAKKLDLPPLSWEQENTISIINAANDSLVELLLCQRSGLETDSGAMFFKLQHDRIGTVLAVLEQQVDGPLNEAWTYDAVCLFCLIDWIEFRSLWDLNPYPRLRAFAAANREREICRDSAPSDA